MEYRQIVAEKELVARKQEEFRNREAALKKARLDNQTAKEELDNRDDQVVFFLGKRNRKQAADGNIESPNQRNAKIDRVSNVRKIKTDEKKLKHSHVEYIPDPANPKKMTKEEKDRAKAEGKEEKDRAKAAEKEEKERKAEAAKKAKAAAAAQKKADAEKWKQARRVKQKKRKLKWSTRKLKQLHLRLLKQEQRNQGAYEDF